MFIMINLKLDQFFLSTFMDFKEYIFEALEEVLDENYKFQEVDLNLDLIYFVLRIWEGYVSVHEAA